MKPFQVGLLQGNYRSAFDETMPHIARVARPKSQLGPEDVRYNRQLFVDQVREAAASGAQLVLGPESYLDGWSCRPDALSLVVSTIPGPEIDELGDLAAELGIWICAGLFIREGTKVYNACVILDDCGQVQVIYRKTHETTSVLSKMPYELGDRLEVFEMPWAKTAVLICHDRWYPEAVRALRKKGAEVILNPSAAATFDPEHAYHDIHTCVLRSQAYLNGVFWINCNGANHGGGSLVVAPDGRIVARASPSPQTLVVDIDPEAHSSYDFLSNLRDGLYRKG